MEERINKEQEMDTRIKKEQEADTRIEKEQEVDTRIEKEQEADARIEKEQEAEYQTGTAFHIQHRLIKSYKKNTLAIFFSFALTISLITSLLILIHTNHKMENIQWQMLFTASDCSVNEISSDKVKQLTSSTMLDWYAVEQSEYKEYSRNTQYIILNRGDDSFITLTTRLDKGRLPKTEHEVVAERWALLNMGIEPVCNQDFEIKNETDGKTETYRLVGILSDVAANKKYGVKCLYAPIKTKGDDNYCVYIHFKEGSRYKENVKELMNTLDIKRKQIKKCPGREDTTELWKIDVKISGVLLFICMVVFYGVYRIAMMSRKKLYGVLRAIGMKRCQLQRMILLELYEIYAVSVPVGMIVGVAIALFISRLSGDSRKEIYLNNEKISFTTVIPIWQIGVCIIIIAGFVGFVGYFSGRKVAGKPVSLLLSHSETNHALSNSWCSLGERFGRNFTLFLLGCKYIAKDKRTSIFVILTICVGVTLFTGLSYQNEIAKTYREDTKEMFYLNGQYEMGTLWVGGALEGIDRECAKRIADLKGVSSMKTEAGIPIRVVDDKSIKRKAAYYEKMNKLFIKYQDYPLAGNDGTDQIYKSILYGYNKNALKELKKYVIAGDFDENGLKEDEIILSVLHMDDTKPDDNPGNYKEGTPLMQYQIGDQIQVKYRADFHTNQISYDKLTDTDAKYCYKTYKVVAIVSFAYMFDCNITIYPLFITSDEQVQKICPDSHIHRMNINGDASYSEEQQEQLERQLIRLGNENDNISTRSMISDIQKNEMLYHKQMVYIVGIAVVSFILVLINMINNLSYRMQTRTREICMFRAIGMSVKMIRFMMVFENGLLGVSGILFAYIISHPVLNYLYRQSDMKAYSHMFHFDYTAFGLIAIVTLLMCLILSVQLSKDWKTKQIMERMGNVE